MTHKPSSKSVQDFLASHTALLRLGSYSELTKKFGPAHSGGLEMPSYVINAVTDDQISVSAFVLVPTLPTEGEEGVLYITPDDTAYFWDEGWRSLAGSGGGTSDFNALTNRPTYNGQPITGSTNIVTDPVDGGEI